jgi:hypothetical protein
MYWMQGKSFLYFISAGCSEHPGANNTAGSIMVNFNWREIGKCKKPPE